MCHSERSEDELLRTLSEKSVYKNRCYQILRDAQDDTFFTFMKHFLLFESASLFEFVL